MIEIMLLVKNHQNVIKNSLESTLPLKPKFIIGDLGSTDGTLAICLQYNAKIIRTPSADRAKCCNELTKYLTGDAVLYLKPGEMLIQGHDNLKKISGVCCLKLLSSDVITKEVRAWEREQQPIFNNPIFEKIDPQNKSIEAIIYSKKETIDIKLLDEWAKANPFSAQPDYYRALYHLENKNFEEFKLLGRRYLFKNKSENIASIMLRYYLALVEALHFKNREGAIEDLIFCLSNQPLMAEFWCLLGDIFFEKKQFSKANKFYHNAILLGSQRLNDDLWPMQISKYQEYPQEMIEKCKSIQEKAKAFKSMRNQAH